MSHLLYFSQENRLAEAEVTPGGNRAKTAITDSEELAIQTADGGVEQIHRALQQRSGLSC